MSWELAALCISVCGPFVAHGAKGKKSTPSIGWEVSVKSLRLASEGKEGAQDLKASSVCNILES